MMRFDLDSLDPLTPLPAPKTAADLEVESWQETRREALGLAITEVIAECVSASLSRLECKARAAEQRDETNAMNEVLRLHHGTDLAPRWLEKTPDNRTHHTSDCTCWLCMKFRYRKMLIESEPTKVMVSAGAVWRAIEEVSVPIKMSGRMDGPADASKPAACSVGVDMGKPGGDQAVVTVWGRRNGKATLLAQFNEYPGQPPTHWEPPRDLPADTQLEVRRENAVRRGCHTCLHEDCLPWNKPCYGCKWPVYSEWEPK